MSALYPLTFTPVYQQMLWGGHRLADTFGRVLPSPHTGESWEVSTRPEGPSRVANGLLRGRSLDEVMREHGTALLGKRWNGERFPLLVKLIDASDRLSVQVHPDDANAAEVGGEAKSEMWYSLAASPSAVVYHGFGDGLDAPCFEAALADGALGDTLRAVRLAPGDALYVPGGLVHAIGAGNLLLEIQQNSNTTYRLDDWGRVGPNGSPRTLHVEAARRVLRYTPGPEPVHGRPQPGSEQELLRTPYFGFHAWSRSEAWSLDPDADSFQYLFCPRGGLRLQGDRFDETFEPATSILVPAACLPCTVTPLHGPAAGVRATL